MVQKYCEKGTFVQKLVLFLKLYKYTIIENIKKKC